MTEKAFLDSYIVQNIFLIFSIGLLISLIIHSLFIFHAYLKMKKKHLLTVIDSKNRKKYFKVLNEESDFIMLGNKKGLFYLEKMFIDKIEDNIIYLDYKLKYNKKDRLWILKTEVELNIEYEEFYSF